MKLSDIKQLEEQKKGLKRKLGLRGEVEPGAMIAKANELSLNTVTKDPAKKLQIKALI